MGSKHESHYTIRLTVQRCKARSLGLLVLNQQGCASQDSYYHPNAGGALTERTAYEWGEAVAS